ncbi:lipid phosphate phosphatase epsilon 1, chloroplastic-like [Chenopodium quinoa]|uniref:Phosphatidic acid phosphatase type 2/haloperoxidase domain-containing protein n=1 Tax=Chenopodium quinoa TaxID=63459 RepID=A0A803KYH9_CHEQI|nr:lipid phosphate phosphatase epsilon 1, chloroplastic-like [Chenopodium quinoa]
MSTTNPLTHFQILSLPTKPNLLTTHSNFPSCSISFHHRCSSPKSSISCDFLSVMYPISLDRRKRSLMGEKFQKIAALRSEDEEENIHVLEQEVLLDGPSKFRSFLLSPEFESTLNRLSKWVVSVLFGAFILWRHDAQAVWAAMGSVLNSVLSVVLKRVLNQERPIANVRSDPGMPSSHSQSIFYIVVFFIMSMIEWLGVNETTVIFAAVSLAFGSYLSWLRVTQKLHSIDQVIVGAVLGSCFSLAWIWSWNAVVSEAFSSIVWVQVSVLLASAICCLAFVLYVILNWFRNDR